MDRKNQLPLSSRALVLHLIGKDEPGYDEALRALYARDRGRFESLTDSWPEDIRAHAPKLAAASMP